MYIEASFPHVHLWHHHFRRRYHQQRRRSSLFIACSKHPSIHLHIYLLLHSSSSTAFNIAHIMSLPVHPHLHSGYYSPSSSSSPLESNSFPVVGPDPDDTTTGDDEDNMFRDMSFDEILEDLNARFLINLPKEEMNLLRVYWQAEQA